MGNGLGSNYPQKGASQAEQIVWLENRVKELEDELEKFNESPSKPTALVHKSYHEQVVKDLKDEIEDLKSRMTIGQINGESCAYCGEPNVWHPDCPRCEINRRDVQIHDLEEVIERVADALLNASTLGATRAVNATFRRHAHRLKDVLADKPATKGENMVESAMKPAHKRKVVYTIIETGDGKSIWRQVGAAFVNRDDSLTVLLDALPVNGRLHIRDPKDGEEAKSGGM